MHQITNLVSTSPDITKCVRLIFFGFIALCMQANVVHAQGLKPVHLELVLAIDTSTSISDAEHYLQKRGLSDAFRHPDVINAIQGLGPLGIAVSVVQWSSNRRQQTVVDWVSVKDAASSLAFASRIDDAQRAFKGMTDIGSAVRYATDSLTTNNYIGERMVIDVSGDGTSYPTSDAEARDRAILKGITTNALVIFSTEHDLGDLANINLKEHFENYVIGGLGAFLMSANDFNDYQVAIRKKLVREIIGPNYAKLDDPLRLEFK